MSVQSKEKQDGVIQMKRMGKTVLRHIMGLEDMNENTAVNKIYKSVGQGTK